MVSGRMRVTHEGTEEEFGPGDLGHIPPGHDGWVVGDEPAVYLDITGSGRSTKPS
jgi:quercetin dioxygenase-like cupin family protein